MIEREEKFVELIRSGKLNLPEWFNKLLEFFCIDEASQTSTSVDKLEEEFYTELHEYFFHPCQPCFTFG